MIAPDDPPASDSLFSGDGEVAALMRSKDWRQTSLGPPESWPLSLRTVVRLMLSSRYAMWMGWGPDLVFLYNDAYREQTLGSKHPWALASKAKDVWAEIWTDISPRVDHVLRGGKSTWDEGLMLFLERSGFSEETYHTFSYSPAPNDAGEPAGLFCVVIEETERTIGERRIKSLRDLASSLSATKTRADVFAAARDALTREARDLCFSLVYVAEPDRRTARRVSQTMFVEGHPGAPELLSLDDPLLPWASCVATPFDGTRVVSLPSDFDWPKGPWAQAPSKAVVVPLRHQGSEAASFFVGGLNPHRPVDESIVGFADLVAGQIDSSLANATAYETERERAESLAELDRAKTAFFGNVSHEFRTPLTLVLGPLDDLLADPDSVSPPVREHLVLARRNGTRLLKLVNTLLDFARIEAGRIEATYEPTDLGALTVDLAAIFRAAVERAGLALVVSQGANAADAYVDREMWEKIVFNLLSNALKHTFEGKIMVSVDSKEGEVVLTVRDTGIGIPESEIPHLFERFHRVRGARSRSHEGTGIGLALVAELVRLHAGTIEVDSAVDRGTTFTVRVPRGREHLPAERVGAPRASSSSTDRAAPYVNEVLRWDRASTSSGGPPSGAPASTATVLPTGRIVLVDDNADMRAFVERLLSEQGWEVRVASDGATAFDHILSARPDLVVSDVMMPGLDGFQLLAKMRNSEALAGTPVILLSARAGEEAAVEGLAAGAADYLVKPFSSRELVARVATHLALGKSRAAEQAAKQRLHAIFALAPVGVSVIRGPDFVFELANARYEAMVGRTGLVGKTLRDAYPELAADAPVFQMMERVRVTGEPFGANEYRVSLDRRGDGVPEDVYFMFTCQPIVDDGGQVDTILTVAVDVTEQVLQRRHIEELAEREGGARRQAEEASRLKDEFLTTVSHELRTPLSAILGWSAMLASEPRGDTSAVRKGIEVIERNARSQLRIIEDILDVSRIVRGQLRVETEPVDLATIVLDVLDSVKHAADAKSIRLELARSDSSHRLVADPERLRQIAWNLLSNAIKFTPEGGYVRVELGQVSGSLALRVVDSGQGIAPAFLPFVFDRFRQAEGSIRRSAGGLGLGLAIVRHLVEMHGGTVTAASAGLGHGASFTVLLPVKPFTAAVPTPVEETPKGATEAPAARSSLAGLRLLVVEDDCDSRELIELLLSAEGAVVETAGSAEEALEKIAAFRPDVLVSDIGMPGRDGYWLMSEVRKLLPTLPAVALTAYTRREDVENARRAGFDEHVGKPVDPGKLVRTIAGLR